LNVVDGSLVDHVWHAAFFKEIRVQHSQYSIYIVYIKVNDFETVVKRVEKRASVTGRSIDLQILQRTFEQVPLSVEQLKQHADETFLFDFSEGT